MGAAKLRRDALERRQPWPQDMHRCPACLGARTRVEPAPAIGMSHIPTLMGACADCGVVWEAYPPGWKHDVVEGEPCDNCAFRQGSPESQDKDGWKDLLAKLRAGGEFKCHKGSPLIIDEAAGTVSFDEAWITAHGRTCAGFLKAMQSWPDWLRNRYPGVAWGGEEGPLA